MLYKIQQRKISHASTTQQCQFNHRKISSSCVENYHVPVSLSILRSLSLSQASRSVFLLKFGNFMEIILEQKKKLWISVIDSFIVISGAFISFGLDDERTH